MSWGTLAASEKFARHTPEPARVRFAMASLVVLGALTALLGVLLEAWFLESAIDTSAAGDCFLALDFGMLAGVLMSAKPFPGLGAGVRIFFTASALLATLSLMALSLAHVGFWLLPPLFALGLAIGALTAGASWLLYGALTVPRASAILNLAGVSFGSGTIVVCFLAWVTATRLTAASLTLLVAIFPAWLAVFSWRERLFRHWSESGPALGAAWREAANPMAVLLGLSLLFQAANLWVIGGWLALYLTRKYGFVEGASLLSLTVYWTALTCSRVLGTRLPPLEERVRALPLASAASLIGCVALLTTASLPGVLAGAVLLGVGFGMIHPITVGMFGRRYPYYHPGFVHGFFGLSLVGGMLAPWLVGQLADPLGIEIVMWFGLVGSVIVFLLLGVVFVETKLTSTSIAFE